MTYSRKAISLRALRSCASGSVVTEFAILFPILLTILTGANELTRWVRARQHMEDYATMVAYDVAGLPVPILGASQSVSAYNLNELIERIGLVAPELVTPGVAAWNPNRTNYLGVTISMVAMAPTTAACQFNCTYSGQLAWTFGSNKRACGAVAVPYGSNAQGALVYVNDQPGAVVVVDVITTYNFIYSGSNALMGMFPGGQSLIASQPTLSTTTFQPVRNWRGGTSNPPLGPSPANTRWTGVTCPGYS